MYRADESEGDEELVEGTVLGGSGDEVSIVPVVYPRGTGSVSSLGYFSSFGSSYKPSHPSLPLSLGVHHIQEYVKKNSGRKRKYIKPQEKKARHEEQMNKMRGQSEQIWLLVIGSRSPWNQELIVHQSRT